MPLPELRTGIDLSPGLNALARKPLMEQQYRQREQAMRTGEMQNALTKRQLGDYDEDREFAQQDRLLKREADVLTLTAEYLKRVGDLEDFNNLGSYMQTKHGMNPDLWPTFESEEEFQKKLPSLIYSAAELAKYKKGLETTVSKVNDDGTISTKTVTPKEFDELQKDPNNKWKHEKITGTPKVDKSDSVYLYNMETKQSERYTKEEADRLQAERPSVYFTPKERKEREKTARDKVPKIKKAIADFEAGKEDKLIDLLRIMDPDAAKRLGGKVDEKTKREVVAAMEAQLKYYEQFLPEKQKKSQYSEGQTATNPNTGERVIFKGGKWEPL